MGQATSGVAMFQPANPWAVASAPTVVTIGRNPNGSPSRRTSKKVVTEMWELITIRTSSDPPDCGPAYTLKHFFVTGEDGRLDFDKIDLHDKNVDAVLERIEKLCPGSVEATAETVPACGKE